ncbi:MAG: nuclear pore complex subunit [Bacteroidetes bacterium HGW-Bacteroidetes-12]|nr:MAG: nuclear pore complex subunit [Bacteroidetes bacterium HGW-Bacteroidetes-12]
MENLFIEGTTTTPKIDFNAQSGTLIIYGRSIPEHPINFYKPIESWLTEYLQTNPQKISLEIHLDYLNTHSTECLFILLKKIETFKIETSNNVSVIWHYDEDDEDLFDMGENFAEMIKIPFKFNPINQ